MRKRFERWLADEADLLEARRRSDQRTRERSVERRGGMRGDREPREPRSRLLREARECGTDSRLAPGREPADIRAGRTVEQVDWIAAIAQLVDEAVLDQVSGTRCEILAEPRRHRGTAPVPPVLLVRARRQIERDQVATRIVARQQIVRVDLEIIEAPRAATQLPVPRPPTSGGCSAPRPRAR